MENNNKNQLNKALIIVSEETGVSVSDIISCSRLRRFADARKVFCKVMRDYPTMKFSLNEIGSFIDRDHATALVAARQAEIIESQDRNFRNIMYRVSDRLYSVFDIDMYNHIPQL